MRPAVLLVSGARALCDTPAAGAWAEATLRAVVDARPWYGVAHGGAAGPDTWAGILAAMARVSEVVYRLDGRVVQDGRELRRWTAAAHPHPLDRNRAMVAALAALTDILDVYVLGLLAPWSRTAGTAFTLTCARDAGLPTWAETCPGELGP